MGLINYIPLSAKIQQHNSKYIPRVTGQIIDGYTKVTCPFCGKEHFHGAFGIDPEELIGPVLSHCGNGTYWIRAVIKVGANGK
jgi:hypothetical protein